MSKLADIFRNLTRDSIDDREVLGIISVVRNGVSYQAFVNMANKSSFSLGEWTSFLHISDRTMQRYKANNLSFDVLQSEKIVQIALLNRRGIDIFGNKKSFDAWLETDSIALDGKRPKDFLDNGFGIDLIERELTRIEHGVLA